jgi:hypothetical protein
MVDILWPGGIRNRFYDLHATENVVLPEIPCSYDGDWDSKHDYRQCVGQALDQLSQQGKTGGGMRGRLMASAMRAFDGARKATR